jgi:UrcA family protein
MNINALLIRRLAVVSSLAVLGMTTWGVVTAGGLQSSSIQVQLADLDLSTPAGRQSAHDRVRQAARTACYRVSDVDDLGRSIHIAACTDRLMAKANVTIGQLASQSESIKVAGSPRQ